MTSSPSETDQVSEQVDHPLQGLVDELAEAVGGQGEIAFDSAKVRVAPENWLSTHQTARDRFDLVYFSFLSAIEWVREVRVGDPLQDENVEERIELITCVADLTPQAWRVVFSTDLPRENPSIPSLIEVYAGANWHEREAHEMFGIDFVGHPKLAPLYLPDGFEGNPLRKSFPLLSREVKPWPGKVDVEAMPEKPSTENPGA